MIKIGTTVLTLALCVNAGLAQAADKWWPLPLQKVTAGKTATFDYVPLEKATKKWNICVLFPHMKDSLWVASAYGIVEEAKRLGVKVTILEAGGYDQLPKQLAQWDDCVAGGAEAVVTAAISEAGMAPKFAEGMKRKIPQVSIINAVMDAPLTGRIRSEFDAIGAAAGQYVTTTFGKDNHSIGLFPGPQSSGWAELYAKGFKASINGTKIKIADEKYGDTGVSIQLKLVEDTLQAFPDLDLIWGSAPTAEAAIQAVDEAGRKKSVKIIASYENQEMADATSRGDILGFATQDVVIQARIGIDLAVRALENKELSPDLRIVPAFVSKDNIEKIDMSRVLAPKGWKPVYSVN